MAVVTFTKREKIGRIVKLVPVQYEIPNYIKCPEDGKKMEFDSYHEQYICLNKTCGHEISVVDFIKQEIEMEKQSTLKK